MRPMRLSRDQLASLPAAQLAGAVLLASVRLHGQRVPKGTRIDLAMAHEALAAAKRGELMDLRIAFPDADDVHEDAAAERLGLAVGGGGVDLEAPRQSKLNLTAKWDGVLHVRVPALLAINAIDQLEVFTLFHGQCVSAGDVVASVKVAPHVVAGEVLRQGIRIAREGEPIIEVRPYQAMDVPAIVCEQISDEGRNRFVAGATAKLSALGSRFIGVIDASATTPERALTMAAEALDRVRASRVVLVAGVAAGDPVSPFHEALAAAGGAFIRQGFPAHPGSMLWLASLGPTRFLGLPSCGMFSLATAADLVLPRLLTGELVDRHSLAELAHGGVLSHSMTFRMPPYARALAAADRDVGEANGATG